LSPGARSFLSRQ